MNKINEVKQKTKINDAILLLKKNSHINNPVLVLIALYDLYMWLSNEDLNSWLQLEEKDKRADFLAKAYFDCRVNRVDLALQEAYMINDIDINLIRNLMLMIAKETLPSMEIAVELHEKLPSKGKQFGYSSSMTNEIAELSHKIIRGTEFSLERIRGNERVAQILCAGPSAILFILRTGNSYSIDYDLLEFLIGGASHIKKLLNIGGVDVNIFGTHTHNIVGKNRQLYEGGLLADAWNAKAYRGVFSHSWSDAASEVNSLPSMIDQVKGRLICVVPSTWLSKTSAQDGSLKKHLIENDLIEAVIQLPTGILDSTTLAPALLVINTSKINSRLEILFIDASGDNFTKQVSRNYKQLTGIERVISLLQSKAGTNISGLKSAKDVIEMNCNLDIKRYVRSPTSIRIDRDLAKFDRVCRLGDIVEIIGCQAIKTEAKMFSQNDTVNEIGATNIDQYGMIDDTKGHKSITPVNRDVNRVIKQQLQAGDIIFAVKGSVGKCALIEPKYEGYITNQSFAILRLRKFPAEEGSWEALMGSEYTLLNGICLFSFLRSELGQAIVNQRVTGSVIPMIKTMDLEEIPVPIPEESVQAEYIVLHQNVIKLIDEKIKLEAKIEEKVSKFWGL